MSIKTVDVYLNHYDLKKKVGTLATQNNTIYFEYDKTFLASGIELSPYKLPLKNGVHICEDDLFDGLFGVFADSLADGWGKLLLDRHLMNQGIKFKEITALDRLSYIGSFGIGALSYEPIFEELDLNHTDIVLDDLASSCQEILKGSSDKLLDTLLAIGGSSAGARPKVMIQINEQNHIIHGSQSLQKGYQHYMVKFPNSLDSQDIGKIEYIYSLMARDSGINIPNTKLLQTQTNSYFAIQRFDRVDDKRVHIHSCAGLSHSDFRMPTVDYDDLLSLTLHLTKDKSQQVMMFRLAVFNLLTHNRDDHAKNFSFLLDEENNWKLSPAYDLTFSYGPGAEHSTTYLGIGKNPSIKQLQELAQKHTIKNGDMVIDEIQTVVKKFKEYAQEQGVSKNIYENIFKNFCLS
jgi:serine/threonine-protein kinase HipA